MGVWVCVVGDFSLSLSIPPVCTYSAQVEPGRSAFMQAAKKEGGPLLALLRREERAASCRDEIPPINLKRRGKH